MILFTAREVRGGHNCTMRVIIPGGKLMKKIQDGRQCPRGIALIKLGIDTIRISRHSPSHYY